MELKSAHERSASLEDINIGQKALQASFRKTLVDYVDVNSDIYEELSLPVRESILVFADKVKEHLNPVIELSNRKEIDAEGYPVQGEGKHYYLPLIDKVLILGAKEDEGHIKGINRKLISHHIQTIEDYNAQEEQKLQFHPFIEEASSTFPYNRIKPNEKFIGSEKLLEFHKQGKLPNWVKLEDPNSSDGKLNQDDLAQLLGAISFIFPEEGGRVDDATLASEYKALEDAFEEMSSKTERKKEEILFQENIANVKRRTRNLCSIIRSIYPNFPDNIKIGGSVGYGPFNLKMFPYLESDFLWLDTQTGNLFTLPREMKSKRKLFKGKQSIMPKLEDKREVADNFWLIFIKSQGDKRIIGSLPEKAKSELVHLDKH